MTEIDIIHIVLVAEIVLAVGIALVAEVVLIVGIGLAAEIVHTVEIVLVVEIAPIIILVDIGLAAGVVLLRGVTLATEVVHVVEIILLVGTTVRQLEEITRAPRIVHQIGDMGEVKAIIHTREVAEAVPIAHLLERIGCIVIMKPRNPNFHLAEMSIT